MACAAERARKRGEQMVPSTMLSVAVELAGLGLYYPEGWQERPRETWLMNPKLASPELAGGWCRDAEVKPL